MYVIPEKKFAFIASPRTGSKAVRDALLSRGATLVGSHHTTPGDNPEVELDKDWTICTTVRNHWDAMISWYFKIERKERAMMPLREFLPRFCEDNPNFVRDGRLWWYGDGWVNTYLRYECLQADFDLALVKAGMASLDLPRVIDSKRGGRPYQVFYKRDTARWVATYFGAEIRKLGYKF